ncbi:MAG: hypothetical protein EZS28_039125 [Streblomastix strix]|uniref:Uncharacterized protein n=1 Tax=Streblomastix strix TaxID=222440 RepID=A0A5J4U4U7_9EUKA|nr:MAG: hypothetical protein EZS28_039125 [Streblomastix strix]
MANLYPDTDEGRRLRSLIIRSGLQWGQAARNFTIAYVEIDIMTRKSEPSQPASRPILRNCDGTKTLDSTAGDVQTNLDRNSILLKTTDTKTTREGNYDEVHGKLKFCGIQ